MRERKKTRYKEKERKFGRERGEMRRKTRDRKSDIWRDKKNRYVETREE